MTFGEWFKTYLFKSTKHVFKRFFQKNIIEYKKKTNTTLYLPRSKYESDAIKICRNIAQNPSTLLEINTNGERCATNDKLNLTFYIYDNSVEVIKNLIPREIMTSPKAHETIMNIFDGHVRMRRDAKKDRVYSSLKSTFESIVEETKLALEETKELNKTNEIVNDKKN